MLELILQFLGEFLVTVLLEACAELFGDLLTAPLRRAPRPVHVGLFMVFAGAAAGALTLLALPHNLLHGGWRAANVVFTPAAVALLVWTLERWRPPAIGRMARGPGAAIVGAPAPVRRAVYAWLFALAVAVVRLGAS